LLQHSTRGPPAKLVDLRPNLRDYAIHHFRETIGCMSGDELLQCAAIKLAARGLELNREALSLVEYFIRY
jgi:hypothetical protein